MTIYKFLPFFENKKNKAMSKDLKPIDENSISLNESIKDNSEQELPIDPNEDSNMDQDGDKMKNSIQLRLKRFMEHGAMKKQPLPKVMIKKSDLEKHPFFQYIPIDVFNKMVKNDENSELEIDEKELKYNYEDLPIQQGDYVRCVDFENLNDRQIEFLRMLPYHKVRFVTNSKGNQFYEYGEPHIDLGYKIPFKMHRFEKVERTIDNKYKILFLEFDLPIDTHGEKDVRNFFKGHSRMPDLFQSLFKEKLSDVFVNFISYNDIYKLGNDFYADDILLKKYDFVFFGFMSNFTTIVKMLISHLDEYKIPYLKYGTYKDYDNKAYEMDLLQRLGYPYIPTIMASKITGPILRNVKSFGFPVIVKDINLNRGEGVWKVDDVNGLLKIFSNMGRVLLIQKFIPNDGDYRVITIKNKVELVIKKERIEGSGEFRANVARGGKAIKGTLPNYIIKMCEDVSRHLVCDIVGFDIIQNKETREYFIMETNSAPHFPTFSVISGINIPGIITDYISNIIRK